ncbi:hypothetical protein ANN_05534 [Periplaneta americana]|uniref:Uncharacterized protein n=1 Tax=Periplaneta americana TaxID=6978 RepID=A0ABQ8TB35_PERAM|nr:hypothetical protein ANN_05534 [Periplaneta americana]
MVRRVWKSTCKHFVIRLRKAMLHGLAYYRVYFNPYDCCIVFGVVLLFSILAKFCVDFFENQNIRQKLSSLYSYKGLFLSLITLIRRFTGESGSIGHRVISDKLVVVGLGASCFLFGCVRSVESKSFFVVILLVHCGLFFLVHNSILCNEPIMKSLMLAGSEFQSLGKAIVKEDEYEEVRWDGIVSIVSWRERVFYTLRCIQLKSTVLVEFWQGKLKYRKKPSFREFSSITNFTFIHRDFVSRSSDERSTFTYHSTYNTYPPIHSYTHISIQGRIKTIYSVMTQNRRRVIKQSAYKRRHSANDEQFYRAAERGLVRSLCTYDLHSPDSIVCQNNNSRLKMVAPFKRFGEGNISEIEFTANIILENPKLTSDLAFIKANFGKLPAYITRNIPLHIAVQVMKKVETILKEIPSSVGETMRNKYLKIVERNSGWEQVLLLNGNDIDITAFPLAYYNNNEDYWRLNGHDYDYTVVITITIKTMTMTAVMTMIMTTAMPLTMTDDNYDYGDADDND